MDKTRESKIYHRVKKRLFFIQLIFTVTILSFLLIGDFSAGLRDLSSRITPNFLVLNGIYISLFFLLMYMIHFPLNFFEEFKWEHRFGLSNQTFAHWLKDDLKRNGIGFTVGLIAVEAIYVFLKFFPSTWWIGAGLFWLFLTLVLAKVTPHVIIPLFYKYLPIEDQRLKDAILELFRKAKVKVQDAYMVDFSKKTKKANAFVCGLGKSRRVVLSDNLLASFSVSEIETVVAHEIGHYKHRDILKLTIVHSCVTFIGFFLMDQLLRFALPKVGLKQLDDIATLPLFGLGFIIFNFFTMPLLNGYSRRLEVQADLFSLVLTQNPGGFISMIEKLGTMNLAEFEPDGLTEFFFYDHPPITKRLKCAKEFAPAA